MQQREEVRLQRDLTVQQDIPATLHTQLMRLRRVAAAQLALAAALLLEKTAQQGISPLLHKLPCNLQSEQTSQTRFIAAQQRV